MRLGLTLNSLLSRTGWIKDLFDPRRDIDEECGHPETILTAEYDRLFRRGDLAARVISVYPEETWSDDPMVFETEDANETAFETSWKETVDRLKVFSVLQRADILSGVGRFGIILIGVDDGLDLRLPVEALNEVGEFVPGQEHQIIYLRPFEERLVNIARLENNVTSRRYGMPLEYNIQFVDTALGLQDDPTGSQAMTSRTVHWSRVIHLADNRTNSEVYGQPRLEKVWNRLLDLRKIVGGSAEMFWRGGFPGLAIEVPVGPGETVEFDKEATKEQIESYQNKLQRYLALVGATAKNLAPNIADPQQHIEAQIRLIASAIACPWRVLMGSEAGKLAADQDSKAWNRRIGRRRESYVTPFIIRPLVDRLMGIGALPEVAQYEVQWNDLNSPSDEEIAGVAEKQTNAITKYIQAGGDALISPFHFLTLVLKMSDDEANAVIEATGDQLMEIDEPEEPEPRRNGEARFANGE